MEDGEDLEQEVRIGALKAVTHRLQDGEHNVKAATKGGDKQRCLFSSSISLRTTCNSFSIYYLLLYQLMVICINGPGKAAPPPPLLLSFFCYPSGHNVNAIEAESKEKHDVWDPTP